MTHFLVVDKICSMLHGIALIILCISMVNPFIIAFNDSHIYGQSTMNQQIISCFSIGYFTYDSIVTSIIYRRKINQKIDIENILHHIVTIIGLSIPIFVVYSGYIVIFAIFWSEVLAPMNHAMNAKYMLLEENNITLTFLIFKIINFVLFCVTRFILIGYCSVQLFTVYSDVYIMYQIMAVLLVIVSLGVLYVTVKELQIIWLQYKLQKMSKYSHVNEENIDMLDIDYEVSQPPFPSSNLL